MPTRLLLLWLWTAAGVVDLVVLVLSILWIRHARRLIRRYGAKLEEDFRRKLMVVAPGTCPVCRQPGELHTPTGVLDCIQRALDGARAELDRQREQVP